MNNQRKNWSYNVIVWMQIYLLLVIYGMRAKLPLKSQETKLISCEK